MIIIKTDSDIKGIEKASRIVAEVLDVVVPENVSPGMSTYELNEIIDRYIRRRGGIPTFLGYQGFPAAACISINEEVVHGIPKKRKKIRKGDLLKVDVGVTIGGYIGDAARTYAIGDVSETARRLMKATFESLYAGIEAARVGNRVSDISLAVENVIKKYGFYAVRALAGHGVGIKLHEDPSVPNYFDPNWHGPRLKHGMTIAIEPMVNVGTWRVYTKKDGWTVVSADRSLSAHYEHTIAITKDGPMILSVLEDAKPKLERYFLNF